MNILVADDDMLSVKLTTFLLESSGYSVITAYNAQDVISRVSQRDPDLVLLDVELSQSNGFEVCRQIRRTSDVPIIFLTGRVRVDDRVMGLQIGGDDYMTKPFEPTELLARIEAVLRRRDSDTVVPISQLCQGDLTVDPIEHRAQFADGHSVQLTPIEFRLLYYMMKNSGRVLSSDQILAKVWRYDDESGNNLVAVYVRRLRNKIEEDPKHPRYIVTLPNLGYKFEPKNEPKMVSNMVA
jgi:DNA-binding response OmpR family regulator